MTRTDPSTTDLEFVDAPDGTRIAYRRIGDGAPLVAIHGGLASSLSWLAVALRLADRHELFLIDRRGRGGSGDGPNSHTLARDVDDAAAVLALAGERAAVLGHSYGGAVALELARTAGPHAVGPLVLYEPAVGVGNRIPAASIDHIEQLVLDGHGDRAVALALDELAAAGIVRSDAPAGAPPSDRHRALAPLAWTVPRELRAVAALGDDVSRYRCVTTPTLVLVGSSSPLAQQAACEALANVLPAGQLRVLDGFGHVAHSADPDRVAEIVGVFLR